LVKSGRDALPRAYPQASILREKASPNRIGLLALMQSTPFFPAAQRKTSKPH
jgi:hypothetical protein